jgi:hypothetical protein
MAMDHEDERPGWVRLPGYERLNPAGPGRADGVRRARRAPVVTSGGSGVAVGSAPGTAGSAAGGTVFWRDN